jgi:hypothetical protein
MKSVSRDIPLTLTKIYAFYIWPYQTREIVEYAELILWLNSFVMDKDKVGIINFHKFLGYVLFIWLCCSVSVEAKSVHHYVFFGTDRERIREAKVFLETKTFAGAQLTYSWRQLEPEKDKYDLSLIREDLKFLTSNGKRLFIQIQDISFGEKFVPVPKYLQSDPQYHGGADRQYQFKNNDESTAMAAGWTARRWDPAVRERFQKLLMALGKEFDGEIEGINLAETSLTFGETGKLYPEGFTPEIYRDGIIANMKALKKAFPISVTLVYANFMPGEWRPSENKGYLDAVYKAAKELKMGVGGPDIFPYKPGQMKSSYSLINEFKGTVGMAFQDGNYEHINPKTGKQVTMPEIIDFATNYLKADYIFWCTEEPFYSGQTVPFVKAIKR